jgi:hypothetical protein
MPNTLPPPRPGPEVWSVATSAMSDGAHQVIVRTAGPTSCKTPELLPSCSVAPPSENCER